MKKTLIYLLTMVALEGGGAPSDDVDPMIGAVTSLPNQNNIHGLGKTFPGAATPFGMIQFSPDTITGGDNGPGYSYLHNTIEGFSLLHMSGIGWYGEFGNFQIMPTTGDRIFDREMAASPFSHSNETARAGYYAVTLDRYHVRAETTALPRAGFMRISYPAGVTRRVQIDLGRRIGQKQRWLEHSRQTVAVVSENAIEGEIVCSSKDGGWGRGDGKVNYTVYFRAEFSAPFSTVGTSEKGGEAKIGKGPHTGTNLMFFAEFTPAETPLETRAAISFTSIEGARENLRQTEAADFESARKRAAALWDKALSSIAVEGGSADERTIFATALYHAMIDPRATGDAGAAESFTRRTVFSGWDVFRSEFPLLTLVRPDVVNDTINSLIDVMKTFKRRRLPIWDILGCDSYCMLGNPALPVIADAWEKGIREYPIETAYACMRRSTDVYGNGKRGWTPDALSHTLEYAYDDWCTAQIAAAIGKAADAEKYLKRSRAWTNCWDSTVGWMRARRADGSWLPWKGREVHEGQGTAESNPLQQGWFVPHDVYGLIDAMGGAGRFAAELEDFFNHSPANFQWNDFYNHPNEPCHHIPYLFAYCGKPWLTQKWTRRICANAYTTGVYGLCGNDDVGQMSAWYVLSALGIHPVCPGSGIWLLTSPVFPKATVRLANGKEFLVTARNVSAANVYIHAARLNNDALERAWLTSSEILSGGKLELELAAEPNEKLFTILPPR